MDLADALGFLQDPNNRKWLIVYDNADDAKTDLRPLLPKCDHGVIVISTRNALLNKLASRGGSLVLDVMEKSEAMDLIVQCAGRDPGGLSDTLQSAARLLPSQASWDVCPWHSLKLDATCLIQVACLASISHFFQITLTS
jgi:hypothetical protein